MGNNIKKPKIVGEWKKLFAPKEFGNYVNDHCIIKGPNDIWHLFGITCFGGGPVNERYFVHATAPDIFNGEEMNEIGKVIDNGRKAWAPCVVEDNGKYYMYYGPSPTGMEVSIDDALYEWFGYEINLIGHPVNAVHRDHMVIKLNDYTWIMYVSGTHNGHGCISVLVSNDLINWRFVQYALTASGNAPLTPPWGAFESPYVVKRDGLYYLFVTYTNCKIENYQDTLVFCSSNPYDFGEYTGDNHNEMVVAEIKSHAGEIIYDDKNDKYYITNCGWRNCGIPVEGGVAIAELSWE